MLAGGVSVGVPQTSSWAGTTEKSCWMWKPSQVFLRCDNGASHTLSALHFSPLSQSPLVSHDRPDDVGSAPDSDFSPVSHVPDLHASPSPHSRSLSQLAPQPFVPFLLPQPGNPGGQSALSLHFAGA